MGSMPVATRSRVTAACGGGEGALAWGSASAAPAPRDGVASHHHGLKEKMRALTLLYDQHKQQIAASQAGGAAARPLRRSIRSLSAAEVVNDENAKNAEEEEQGGGLRRRMGARHGAATGRQLSRRLWTGVAGNGEAREREGVPSLVSGERRKREGGKWWRWWPWATGGSAFQPNSRWGHSH